MVVKHVDSCAEDDADGDNRRWCSEGTQVQRIVAEVMKRDKTERSDSNHVTQGNIKRDLLPVSSYRGAA